MQYHNMLKQKHQMEAKTAEDAAKKKKEIEGKVNAEKQKELDAKQRIVDAETLAQQLIQEEEQGKKGSKGSKASASGMKKGFLNKK